MGRHASGPPPDPNDELRDIFRMEPFDEETRRQGRRACVSALVAGLGTWAVVQSTGGLGPWRYLLIVPVGLGAVSVGLGAVVFLLGEVVAKATAKDAPRWLRFVTRNLGNGLVGLALGGLVLASVVLSYPQPRPLSFYVAIPAAGFVAGVVAGVRRRRRRRARWCNAVDGQAAD